MRLDIGGGKAPASGYLNLDPIHGEGELKRRVQDGIPFADASVEMARCSHLLEHIPAGWERIAVFNEVHRVLVPGGTFDILVPLLTAHIVRDGDEIQAVIDPGAIADPTHVSFWVKGSFDYFTHDWPVNADYGMARWEWVEWSTRPFDWGTEGHATLRKPL